MPQLRLSSKSSTIKQISNHILMEKYTLIQIMLLRLCLLKFEVNIA